MARILLVANTAWSLANFRSGLIRALMDDGHEIVALAPRDAGTPSLEALGCRTLDIEIDNKGTSPFRDAVLYASFLRIFRKERPDIVLSYTIKCNIYGALAARALGMPFLPNVTGLGTAFIRDTWLTRLVSGLYRSAFSRLPQVFFLNGDDAGLFVERGLVRPAQVSVLPGEGIDLDYFPPTPQRDNTDRPVFLMIARMLRDKGVVEFVGAAEQLRQQGVAARFQLLGPLDAANQTAIGRQTMSGWVNAGLVEYLGITEDVRPFIAASDCVVLPSYREGLPRVLLEASAMQRAVIATNVPGCRDVVADGETGLLCEARSVEGLANAMAAILELSPRDRMRMGQAGRNRVASRFAQQTVTETYRAAIAGTLNGQPGNPDAGAFDPNSAD